jgi:5-dehydro-2-deoxygluconokinase
MQTPVYMLAIDHRWQWEEWCDANSVARTAIPAVKLLAAEAFLLSRSRSALVRVSGALLVDLTYGRDAFETARAAGAVTGTPAERAGAFPLEWTAPFDEALPGDFVKVLVRHRADVPPDVVSRQRQQLLELQDWCRSRRRTLVLEVLVSPGAGEVQNDEFEAHVRPRLLADYIDACYAIGLVPAFWKIEGMPDRAAFGVVEAAIRRVDGPRQLILGKGAGMDAVRRWFGVAAGAPTAAGFAIGRTVYFAPASEWLLGRLDRDAALARIAETYEEIVAAWEQCTGAAAAEQST